MLFFSAICQLAVAYTDRGILKLDNTCAPCSPIAQALSAFTAHILHLLLNALRLCQIHQRNHWLSPSFSASSRVRSTFDRIVDGSRSVMVRFDKEYSYGDEHDAWKSFAAKVGDSSADMLVCDVGVSEYGDKDNSDIAEKFSIKSDDFPQYRLWKKGSKEPLVYKGDKKEDAFLRFAQAEADIWVGLTGQLKEFDALAKAFPGDKAGSLKKAEAAAKGAGEKDADSAKYYVKVGGKTAQSQRDRAAAIPRSSGTASPAAPASSLFLLR